MNWILIMTIVGFVVNVITMLSVAFIAWHLFKNRFDKNEQLKVTTFLLNGWTELKDKIHDILPHFDKKETSAPETFTPQEEVEEKAAKPIIKAVKKAKNAKHTS